jgi:hypothetical protein
MAALEAAIIAAVPWTGQGFIREPLPNTPTVFFDGTKGIAAAVFVPPATGFVLPLSPDTSQQQSEMLAGELAVHAVAASAWHAAILAGDSTATLGALRKLSTPIAFPHRAQSLRRIALSVLQHGTRFSLAKVPGAGPARNPADPLARIFVHTPSVLGADHPAVRKAQSLWAACNPTPLYSEPA